MALRIHPLSRAQWARLAESRFAGANNGRVIDLVELETHPGLRMRAEHARIQAYVDALAPQVAR